MFDITPLDAAFGAEVRGWDPSRALTTAEEAELRNALREHALLVLLGDQRTHAGLRIQRITGYVGFTALGCEALHELIVNAALHQQA